MKRAIKFICFTLLSIIIVILLTVTSLFYIFPLFEHGPSGKVTGSNNWMKDLNDEMLISEVVLPGSHDTGAINCDLAYFAKCQSLSVLEQLEAGFRYLDIRLDITDDGKLCLMHGFIHCRKRNFPTSKYLYLEDVLNDCYTFLDNNPTECLVFAIKSEGDNSIDDLNALLMEQVLANEKYWLETSDIPKVKDLRGKILLLTRYSNRLESQKYGLYFNWSDQGNTRETTKHIEENNNDLFYLYVQDRYKYDIFDKLEAFLNCINYEIEHTNYIKLSFLSTNGNVTYGHPYKYAKQLNKILIDDDIKLNGWVIVDFCSPKLAERIYQENFK